MYAMKWCETLATVWTKRRGKFTTVRPFLGIHLLSGTNKTSRSLKYITQ